MGKRDPYEWNTHLGHVSAWVLIGGLALELINGLVWFHGPETVSGMVAIFLIGGGVWGEVHFGNKARIAGDTQIAGYKARADEANARALEAQLALEKFKAGRMLSPEQAADVASKMSDWANSASGFERRVAVFAVSKTHEAARLADQLADVLGPSGAKWSVNRYPVMYGNSYAVSGVGILRAVEI
jgi:hypothetical protein